MKLIVGLGNPGQRYNNTRHNVGFMALDRFAEHNKTGFDKSRFNSLYCDFRFNEEKIVLMKPLTYMNLSGNAVSQAILFYDADLSSLMVVVDDFSLDLGALRIRIKGSSGGHNGLEDIIRKTGTNEFPRMRIGVGNPPHNEAVDHVLGKFNNKELEVLNETLDNSVKALDCWLRDGLDACMNIFNRKE